MAFSLFIRWRREEDMLQRREIAEFVTETIEIRSINALSLCHVPLLRFSSCSIALSEWSFENINDAN
jgi:hypothetical protein